MTKPLARLLVALTLTSLLLSLAPFSARACSPEPLQAVFSYSKHPDLPLDAFARGRLGVLKNTYARSYLLVAYRYMMNADLNAAEQQAVVSLWNERLENSWEHEEKQEDALKVWLAARGKVSGIGQEPPQVNIYRRTSSTNYYSYLNCQRDSFAAAARTLNERIAKYGADNPVVKNWVAAQDQVFANCSSGEATIPAPLPADADALARADRNYQIAAANFYAAHFDEAKTLFDQIAQDNSSPYAKLASYLAARALIRKASLNSDDGKVDKETLSQAETQLERVIADENLRETHAAARRMLNLVRYRLEPEKRLQELARDILRPNSEPTIRQDLWDFTLLLDRFGENNDESATDKEDESRELPEVIRSLEVADWAFTIQGAGRGAAAHAVQKWTETRSLPWLVAALINARRDTPQLEELIVAGERIEPNSHAFSTVAYHIVRLLAGAGKYDEARRKLDSVLSNKSDLPPSAVSDFTSQRMTLARNLKEFLRYAPRTPVGFTYDYSGNELPESAGDISKDEAAREYASNSRPLFDTDAVTALNAAMPLNVLAQAATSDALPAHLRRELAIAVWVRAALLDDVEQGRAVVPVLQTLAPELREHLAAYELADSVEAKRFAILFAALKLPGLRPLVNEGLGRMMSIAERDIYRDNWWCAFNKSDDEQIYNNAALTTEQNKQPALAPVFLTQQQRAQAQRELTALAGLGTGPNYLCRQTVLWARAHPNDARVPEALHLAVRSTRYGCVDKDTEQFSRTAFQLLHSRYGRTAWAARTPYWFKGYE